MRSARLWVILALLVSTFALLRIRGDADRIPPSRPLAELPSTIGLWSSVDLPLDQEVLDVLGKGVFLNRIYTRPDSSPQASIGLFIGYFPTQRTGQSIHSPQNCLPGAGWTFDSSGVTQLRDAGGKIYRVGEYVISDGRVRQEVLYWYRSHGRTIAGDYAAKLYMLAEAIRYDRTDAALVRVITPVQPGEGQPAAHRRAVAFAEQMAPLLSPYIPE